MAINDFERFKEHHSSTIPVIKNIFASFWWAGQLCISIAMHPRGIISGFSDRLEHSFTLISIIKNLAAICQILIGWKWRSSQIWPINIIHDGEAPHAKNNEARVWVQVASLRHFLGNPCAESKVGWDHSPSSSLKRSGTPVAKRKGLSGASGITTYSNH